MSDSYRTTFTVSLGVVAVIAIHAIAQAQPGSTDANDPYRKVENWPQLPANVELRSVIGILPDGQGNLWMLHRSEPPIIKLDSEGKMVQGFGHGMFVHAHGFCMDADGNLWAGDSGAPFPETTGMEGRGLQFFKFSQDGTLLMTLGKAGVSEMGPDTFVAPSACVVAPNGDIIIADGHIPRAANQEDGDRLLRFSKDGNFIRAYGKTGSGPGEFRDPHALAFDSQGRLFVADRQNDRLQIFDENINFIAQWKQFGRPSGLAILEDDTLVTMDSESGRTLSWVDGGPPNPGFKTGVRIGSTKDGSVSVHFEGPVSEVVAADVMGNIYTGADKYVKSPSR